jgi:AhpD family alkylhydroperoxidase
MQTIPPIAILGRDAAIGASGLASHILATNMIRTMAQSPCALEGYLQLRSALDRGMLSAKIREQIALAVAQENLCEYSLAEHAHFAAQLGLTNGEIQTSRVAWAIDRRTNAILRFARDLAARKGQCSLVELRENGCGDSDIIELVACVALNVFENYLNDVALTELDFPRIGRGARAA